jgi:hypothetical protein
MAGKHRGKSNGPAGEQHEMDGSSTQPEEGPQTQQEDEGQRHNIGGRRAPEDETEELKILYTNAQSLFEKLDELLATASILQPDVILITETWTNGGLTDAMLQLPGYRLEGRQDRQDTQNGIGGGLVFYVKECYDTEPVSEFDNNFNQYSMVSINARGTKINFLLIYRPPSSNVENLVNLCELLSSAKTNTIAIGDFNMPGINWKEGTADSHGRRLLDVMEATNMIQLVEFPTHKKGNILDLVITNCQDKCKLVRDIGFLGASDHCMIELVIETKIAKQTMPARYIWSKGNYDEIRKELRLIKWHDEMSTRDVEHSWQFFKTSVLEIVNKYVPKSVLRGAGQPKWLRREIKK